MWRASIIGMATACACAWAAPAQAFKPDTHIWLASRVIDELRHHPNGRVIIVVGGKARTFTVSPSVRRAILRYPATYCLGAVGPDALPGIYEGQNAIHPGGTKWGTGEWLDHVLRSATTDEEIAFAYGMIAHAAGDVWAHSYINHYAGNIFLLTDGEVTVEARHMVLEGYIAAHAKWATPSGLTGGQAADALIRRGGGFALPADFLFRTFIESDEASDAFAAGSSNDITAVHNLYKGLGRLAQKDGPADRLHHLIQKAVIYWRTGYNARESELATINKVHQGIQDKTNQSIDKLQAAGNKLRAVNRLWLAKQAGNSEHLFDVVATALNDASKAIKEEQKLEDEAIEAKAKLDKALQLPLIPYTYTCQITELDPILGSIIKKSGVCNGAKQDPSVAILRAAFDQKHQLESTALKSQQDDIQRAKSALDQAYASMLSAYDTETTALNAAINMAQRFETNENPIKSMILAWQSDIKQAMIDYFIANTEAIDRTMVGGDPLDPLSRWLSCRAPTIVGIPSPVMDTTCSAKDTFASIMATLDAIKRVDPIGNELMNLKEEITEQLTQLAKDKALDFASKLTSIDFKAFLNAATLPPTAASLNSQFVTAPAPTRLITASAFNKVVDTDMALDIGGYLDPDKFSPVRNASTLMKMSLLSRGQVALLLGRQLPKSSLNVMSQFAHSIDGDYQWMTLSPKYARTSFPFQAPEDEGLKRSYSYRVYPDWRRPQDRAAFRRIFSGPLNPGFLAGSFSTAVPKDYTFRPTADCPFPNTRQGVDCN
jgi:hypothetical protein